MILLLTVVAFVVQFVLPAPSADDLIISLPNGKVQGTTYLTDNNKTYYGFQGIPFAAPPVGSLRFEAPQPAKPWDGVLDATKDGHGCLSAQHFMFTDIEDEDCLNINVYTPYLKPTENLPVMVWIYGGKFVTGNALKVSYGPDFLIEEDVVFVSFNYRVGPFGFLSTGDTAITGNAGLKDQTLALKWVKENIEHFGGDPDKVTIFGESAGGGSASFQLISPKSAGLFRAAIVESGISLANWAIDEDPLSYAVLLTEALGGGDYVNDTQELKKFLQDTPALEILDAANSFKSGWSKIPMGLDFCPTDQAWPVIEVENEEAFLTESPYSLLDSGRFNQVPIIIGICANEAVSLLETLETSLKIAKKFDEDPSLIVPTDLHPNTTDLDTVVKTIQNMYLKEGENFTSNLVALTSFHTDTFFAIPTIKTAELHAKHVPVYLYQFAYYGRPINSFLVDGAEKAGHAGELAFLLNTGPIVSRTYSNSTESDLVTQNRMVKLWTNFAKYLNPTPEESELLNNVTWPVTSQTEFQFLNINNTLEVRSHLRATYPEWTDIYDTYGRKPFITY